ncbi:hypothetical protein ON010_g17558 [Phytophthora cinnamomi]|nr:hypothetical protein ON010_g17558 [Phytophthora cinnamomi]
MYAAGVPPPGAARPPTSSVELSLSAKDLKDRDIISKSDPFAVLYARSDAGWTQLGRTEMKKDDLNPKWAKLFLVEFHFEIVQQLKVDVYDQDNSSPDKLNEQDYIGGAEFTLGQLMGAPGQSGTFLLTRGKNKSKHQGSLLVRADEVKASSEAVRLRFSATALASMDGFFSKSDPFLVISRLREDGASWTQVHRTETIDNNLNPNWKRFELPLQQLCNGDHRRPLRLEVFDEDRGGKFQLIGQVQTTMEEILGKRGTNYVLHNEALQKKKGKKYTNAGLLVIAEHAISATVTILQEYDADKQFPVYGFGGIPPGAHDVDHCFALNLNPSNPEVAGSHGVLQVQFALLGRVEVSIMNQYCGCMMVTALHSVSWSCSSTWSNLLRPVRHHLLSTTMLSLELAVLHNVWCYTNRLINQSMRIAKQLNDPRKQKYFVLLIITGRNCGSTVRSFSKVVVETNAAVYIIYTDGAIMDMQGTIDAIVEASHTSPLSIVIIGVGPADFSTMVALDGDGDTLRASNGRASARDMYVFRNAFC